MAGTMAASTGPGRRERKKRQTRDDIAAAALELFLDRGFDRVTVAQVAEAADVAEQTVFNHFRTKEDLVYARLDEYEDELVTAVRDRVPGDGVVEAFGRALNVPGGLLADPDPAARAQLVAVSHMIAASPALQRREEQVYASRTDALAQVLEPEYDGPVQAWVVANALVGVHRALVVRTREAVLEGVATDEIADVIHREAGAALDLLAHGLAADSRRGSQGTPHIRRHS